MPRGPEPILAGWGDAPDVIRGLLLGLRAARPHPLPLVVGITGPVGSGKSTLARRLGGATLSTDHYLPDYADLPEHERDEPRHAALPLLAEHLGALRRGEPVEAPCWSFHTHRREGCRSVRPTPLVVCEGLFALREELLEHLDLRVYVDAPRDLRRARWEAIERAGDRGWGPQRALAYLDEVADPTFDRYAPHYRAAAGVIVENHGIQRPVAGPDPGRND